MDFIDGSLYQVDQTAHGGGCRPPPPARRAGLASPGINTAAVKSSLPENLPHAGALRDIAYSQRKYFHIIFNMRRSSGPSFS
jgi:hypothetical protein